ncbi:hypothetical protein J4230_03625 [Candidatus Woesearchaeota archaeon]|nr:hypothetical protein [Candidatus Woesearchaeota archaeon]
MVKTTRDRVEDFLLCLGAEIMHGDKMQRIAGMLFFGSYTYSEQFADIDIVAVLSGEFRDLGELKERSKYDRRWLKYFLEEASSGWKIPYFQNQGYFGIFETRPRRIEEELRQLERQIRVVYKNFADVNSITISAREEIGLFKPPRDFRFSSEKLFWRDEYLKKEVSGMLFRINLDYEEVIRSYNRATVIL